MHLLSIKIIAKIKSMISIGGGLFLLFSCLVIASFFYHLDTLFEFEDNIPYSIGTIPLQNNMIYFEQITGVSGTLKKINMAFDTSQGYPSGLISVTIRSDSEIYERWEVDTNSIGNNLPKEFKLSSPITINQNTPLYLEIQAHYKNNGAISLHLTQSPNTIYSNENTYENSAFYAQWIIENTELKYSLLPICVIGILIIFILCIAFIDFSHFNYKISIILFILILLSIRVLDYDLYSRIKTVSYERTYSETEYFHTIAPGESRQYIFSINLIPCNTIELFFVNDIYEDIHIQLCSLNDENIYFDDVISKCNFIAEAKAGQIAARLSLPNSLPLGNYALTITNLGNTDQKIEVSENGEINLIIFQRSFIMCYIILFILFLIAVTLIITTFGFAPKRNIASYYLALLIPLSIIYLVIFVPGTHPDSTSHILATYRISNLMLGYSGDQEWYMRESDYYTYSALIGYNPYSEYYYKSMYSFSSPCPSSEMVDTVFHEDKMKYYSVLNYLPEALGLSLGRILSWGFIPSLYLGRIFLLTIYIFFTYRAVKRTPIGKMIIATICTFPMSLMMSSAISYDPLVIISTVCFISSILYLAHNPSSQMALIESAIWCFIIGSIKGGGYLLLLPLVLILFTKKDRSTSLRKISIISLAGICSVIIFDVIIPFGSQLFQFGVEGNGKFSISLAFQDPLHFLDMSLKSYLVYTDLIAGDIGGTSLAWQEPVIPFAIIICLFIICIVYSIFETDDYSLVNSNKFVMIIIVLLGIVTTPAMLLSWTDIGKSQIDGLQGRYFLPLFPLVLFLITKFSTHCPCQEKMVLIKSKLLSLYTIISCIAVYYMMRLYFTR